MLKVDDTRLYDNTRLKDFVCPRYYYFRHELGWVPTSEGPTPPNPLAFGSAHHAGMDRIWIRLAQDKATDHTDVLEDAHEAWLTEWKERGCPTDLDIDQIKKSLGRNPTNGKEILKAYIEEHANFIRSIELLDVEKAFAVPLDPEDPTLMYCGRIDKVIRMSGEIVVVEHKTTSKLTADYVSSWSPDSQVDGYLHATRCLYGPKVRRAIVDASLVSTSTRKFEVIPIERTNEQLEAWLYEAREKIRRIEAYRETEDSERVLKAFPKETSQCWNYARLCDFHRLCKAWHDPHKRGLPVGYGVKRWSPSERLGMTNEANFNPEKLND